MESVSTRNDFQFILRFIERMINVTNTVRIEKDGNHDSAAAATATRGGGGCNRSGTAQQGSRGRKENRRLKMEIAALKEREQFLKNEMALQEQRYQQRREDELRLERERREEERRLERERREEDRSSNREMLQMVMTSMMNRTLERTRLNTLDGRR